MKKLRVISISVLAFVVAGCGQSQGANVAVVGDHRVEGTDGFDYSLVDIDGSPFKKERVSFWRDMNPGAVTAAGTHKFTVRIESHRRSVANVAREATFTASVSAGKRYFIGTKEGAPILIEEKEKKPNQASEPTAAAGRGSS